MLCYPQDNLLRIFNNLHDGDVLDLVGPGTWTVAPPEPVNTANLPNAGAALSLEGKSDILIRGHGRVIIQASSHGSIIGRRRCSNVHLEGIIFKGQGYITEPVPYYFALVQYNGGNEFCDTLRCAAIDSGNHGIAELHVNGPSDSDHCRIWNCRAIRCGHLKHPIHGGDGAGIAMGGSYNTIDECWAIECLRGFEGETHDPSHPTRGNRLTRCKFSKSLWQAVVWIPEHGRTELFTENVVADNYIEGTAGSPRDAAPPCGWGSVEHGIEIWGGQRYWITGNIICNLRDWVGLRLTCEKCQLRESVAAHNSIDQVGRTGIRVEGASDVFLVNNNIGVTGGEPIYLGGYRCTALENMIKPHPVYGTVTCADKSAGNVVSGTILV